ncbi:MAG: hemerythrin domain-containing protein [Legionella sp.]|nr:MAG: hemerythrin domain-containing protein [Legionella sp.]
MNAIDFLIKEHNKFRTMFADINDPSHREETRRRIFETIHDELIRHEEMEQTVWYPYLRAEANKRLNDRVKHLISEEYSAKKLMDHLSKIKNSDNWEQELLKLQKDVEHHASEEEEELFPQVQKIFEDSELEMIGKKMRAFKNTH